MKRNEFIKTSSLVIAGGLMTPYLACSPKEEASASAASSTARKNWAGNYTYKAPNLHEPTTVEELQGLVKSLNKQKALGSRHCFNEIADSSENQISTRKLNKIVKLDEENKLLTVEAGARYGEFSVGLHEKGFGLHNLASLPHITVGGACTTATHGSGITNGNLASKVVAIELVTPQGDIVNLDRNHPDFPAIVVGLGAFGIISRFTLEVEDTYDVRQDVFLNMPLASVETRFDEIMSSGYSVSFFTNWLDKKISEVWVKSRMDAGAGELGNDFYGATAATENVHPVIEQSAEKCSEQMGVPGPWYERLPHFKMGFTPSTGDELHSEFFVPRENAVDAIMAVEKLRNIVYPQLIITEIRTIAADEFWMSPCYQRNSVSIHFTWKPKTKEVLAAIPKVEAALAPYDARPHWGKLFKIDRSTLHERYERFGDFLALAKKYDPQGKFRNDYLNLNVYG